MANVTLDAETLYYQYMINNNPTSTMLNAISGNSSDDSSLGLMGSLGALNSLGSLDALGMSGISGVLGSLDSSGSVMGFANVLERCLSSAKTTAYTESIEAAEMADKLSSVLEEAAETEDTSSLTYKTVQELYEYFSEKVSSKAATLLGDAAGTGKASTTSAASSAGGAASSVEQMNQAAMKGQEFDFSEMDAMVDAAFEEQMPLS